MKGLPWMTIVEPSLFSQCLQGKAVCTANGGPGSAVPSTYSYVYLRFFFPFHIPGWISLSFWGKGGNGKTVFCQGWVGGCQFGWQYVTQGSLGENAFPFHWTFWSLYHLERHAVWKRAGRKGTLLLFSFQTRIKRQFCVSQLIISPSVLKNNMQKLWFRLFKKCDQKYYLSCRSWGNSNFFW